MDDGRLKYAGELRLVDCVDFHNDFVVCLLFAYFHVSIIAWVLNRYGALGGMHSDKLGVERDESLVRDPGGTYATGAVHQRASEWVIVGPSLWSVLGFANKFGDHFRQADGVGDGLGCCSKIRQSPLVSFQEGC